MNSKGISLFLSFLSTKKNVINIFANHLYDYTFITVSLYLLQRIHRVGSSVTMCLY